MTNTVDIHKKWVDQLKNGDKTVARNIYDSYSKAMYNTLIRISGNSEDAQDLLQDSFIKAFQNIHSFRGESSFGSWLKRICINTGLEYLRKKKIEFEEFTENFDIGEEDLSVEMDPIVIHNAIKDLPDGCRTVLSLYLLEGYSHNEISSYLGISVSTSKTQYMRGKSMLRNQLKTKIYG